MYEKNNKAYASGKNKRRTFDMRGRSADSIQSSFRRIVGAEKHTIFILILIKKKKSIRVFMILVDFLLDEI